ncbi:conjugal transfer protein TrbF (plasmid) [Rhizorhabdus wittichii DC-6]|uniref:conjugal transfer protein TrbF n=1 Tax=Novosphingobium sp. KN65.2 TaxID=1478134 RepID=UPI0004AB73BF|nr:MULTISPECIES: conjugal transfer protein TrbF [Sphingomonadaceae]ARR57696.1 conjugal transfer protein TrbF [Rhizorhabdus wittichii DC-6]CDO34546.1 Conjugal transfer protein [Novosphingobium sp. KN65.2]
MKNLFRRSTPSYGSSAPLNSPYAKAAQEWDNRIGSARVQAKNWRIATFIALGIAGAAVASNIYLATTTRVATYVVPVNELGKPGKIVAAGQVYEPSRAETAYFLADWVQLVRSKSTDGVVIRQNWQNAYNFITAQAEQTLNTYAKENDPFANVGQDARTIEVQAVLPRSKDTYQVTWRETAYTNGTPMPPERWTGLFTVRVKPPKTEQELRANPLGIFITNFQWSREL